MRNFAIALILIAFLVILAITDNFFGVAAWIISTHKLQILNALIFILGAYGFYRVCKQLVEKHKQKNIA